MWRENYSNYVLLLQLKNPSETSIILEMVKTCNIKLTQICRWQFQ
jgi:hypothetical protein